MRMKLTDATIAALAAGGKRLVVRDTALTGFTLRLGAAGAKTFGFEYRKRGVGRSASATTYTIGRWPALREPQARRIAQGLAVDVARDGDPREERRERVAKQTLSLKRLLAEGGPYEIALQRRGLVNVKTALSSLRRELVPLLDHDPSKLTRAHYVKQITGLQDRGLPGAAADLRKFAYSFVEWCLQMGHCQHNPLAGWRSPPRTRAERLAKVATGRALPDAEIVALWQAAADDATSFGLLVQLGLLTAMRRGELAGLQWTDVHADRIVLAAGATKTGTAHMVPLTDLMRGVIARVPKTLSPLVFPSPAGRRFSSWTEAVAALQKRSGVEVRMHDLRFCGRPRR